MVGVLHRRQVTGVLVLVWLAAANAALADPQVVLRGRVTDRATGAALAGVEVAARDAEDGAALAHATTDVQGAYALTIASATGHTIRVEAVAEHLCAVGLTARMRTGDDRTYEGVDFALPPGVPFSVRVLDATGAPCPSCRVRLRRLVTPDPGEGPDENAPFADEPFTGATGADGICAWKGVIPGDYRVEAELPGGTEPAATRIAGGETLEIRVPASPEEQAVRFETVRGYVRHRGDLAAIPGVVVSARQAKCITNAEGAYELTGLPTNEQVVIAYRAPWESAKDLPHLESIWLHGETESENIDTVMLDPDTLRIAGRVVANDGRGALGARVRILFGRGIDAGWLELGRETTWSVIPDLDGSFDMGISCALPAVVIVAQHPRLGRGRSTVQPVALLGKGRTLVARLEPGVDLRGRVTNGQGNPIPGAAIAAQSYVMGLAAHPEDHLYPDRVVAVSDRDGHFFLPNVPTGPRVVSAGAVGYATHDQRYLDVEPDTAPGPLDIVLNRVKTVSGKLVDADGKGVQADLTVVGRWSHETRTGQDGGFALDDVPLAQTEFEIDVFVRNAGTRRIHAALRNGRLDLVLPKDQ